MAQNLQLLKRRIKTSKNISQIAKAMEMISASKIKRAQMAVENNKPYAKKVNDMTTKLIKTFDTSFGSFSSNTKILKHPYINPPALDLSDGYSNNDKKTPEKKLLIAISPDKGLCGSLNTNFFKKMWEINKSDTYLVTMGNKVSKFAPKLDFDLVASYPMGSSLPTFAKVYELTSFIKEYYMSGKVAKVDIAYTEFNTFFSLIPTVTTILPIKQVETREGIEEDKTSSYLFEPNITTLLEALLPHYVEIKIYSALIEAYTSEQAARMAAMQNAKTNANDIADYLTLAYNKSRQERITNDILDITNASA